MSDLVLTLARKISLEYISSPTGVGVLPLSLQGQKREEKSARYLVGQDSIQFADFFKSTSH